MIHSSESRPYLIGEDPIPESHPIPPLEGERFASRDGAVFEYRQGKCVKVRGAVLSDAVDREAAAIEAAAEVLIGTLGISPDSPPFMALATATVRAYLEALASQEHSLG